ncbi:MAG: tRNA guanosine(15) transglycosylase TgtA [Candidatus Hadarchaeales archaeon]
MSEIGCFEIIQRDGLARIGKFYTRHGKVVTPSLMPVINPIDIFLSPSEMVKCGAEIFITNAYLMKKHYGEKAAELGVHKVIGYDGPIMTDSGGYQILRYGVIDTTQEEIVRYQEAIGSDIATILDVPTGANATRRMAEETVKITIERAEQLMKIKSRDDILWCCPVQGGLFTDLVRECARKMADLDFAVYAIGSPVELLETYRFAEVVELTMNAKMNLPFGKPVHLFGVGHPMVLGLAVAMGCDLFDSAAYALYARDDRYLTENGTIRVENLEHLPCSCPACSDLNARDLKEMEKNDRMLFLARHNLYVTFEEIKRIRQAIAEGWLFDLIQQRCRAHPKLLEGLRKFLKYKDFVERFDPVTKKSAFFYLGSESAHRPEVVRHHMRIKRISPPPAKVLVLLPFYLTEKFERDELEEPSYVVKILPPFGPVPEDLEEIFPLMQNEIPPEVDAEGLEIAMAAVKEFLKRHAGNYEKIILFDDGKWGDVLKKACEIVGEKLKVLNYSESVV